MTTPRLLDAEQVAARLGMSPRWVLAEARAGRLPAYHLGRRIRFDDAEVAAYLAAHHRPAVDGLRIVHPTAHAKPARRAGSRGRVPSVTPPAALYPVDRAS